MCKPDDYRAVLVGVRGSDLEPLAGSPLQLPRSNPKDP